MMVNIYFYFCFFFIVQERKNIVCIQVLFSYDRIFNGYDFIISMNVCGFIGVISQRCYYNDGVIKNYEFNIDFVEVVFKLFIDSNEIFGRNIVIVWIQFIEYGVDGFFNYGIFISVFNVFGVDIVYQFFYFILVSQFVV